MTQQIDISDDPNYIALLNHGFVGLVDTMGSDQAVCRAARTSYGKGTKLAREDRILIRYLMRMFHTSPFEMTAIKLHIKAPIFVLRQLFRHRTHAANEYSGRYSIMTDEFYVPDDANISPQATTNRQGRDGAISDVSKAGVKWLMNTAHQHSYDIYKLLLGEFVTDDAKVNALYDPYAEDDPLFDPEFPGVARELARVVLPLSTYSELYWQQSIHNMFHLIKLRADSHAQQEIRYYADAIYQLIQPQFPECCKAFEDYVNKATSLSRMETQLTKEMFHNGGVVWLKAQIAQMGSVGDFAASRDMSAREMNDFLKRFDL